MRYRILAVLFTTATSAFADTFVVTNTSDHGPGSVREAINAANASTESGFHLIRFDLPCGSGGGQPTIVLHLGLPVVTGAVDIDGTTACGNVVVVPAGEEYIHWGFQFIFNPPSGRFDLYQALRHVDINGFDGGVLNQGPPVRYSGRTGMLMTGCRINAFGSGVVLGAVTGAVIGQVTDSSTTAPMNGGNVITGPGSSSAGHGIYVFQGSGHAFRGNVVEFGVTALQIEDCPGNVVGGNTPAEGNTLTAWGDNGIALYVHSMRAIGGSTISHNYITPTRRPVAQDRLLPEA